MKIKFDDCLTIGNFNEASVCIIWLHGYGANNWTFEPLMKMLHLELGEKIFIVIPNAPIENQKRSWYPLPQNNEAGDLEEDYKGVQETERGLVQQLNEKYGPGQLDPQTGVFTPAPEPEEQEVPAQEDDSAKA